MGHKKRIDENIYPLPLKSALLTKSKSMKKNLHYKCSLKYSELVQTKVKRC